MNKSATENEPTHKTNRRKLRFVTAILPLTFGLTACAVTHQRSEAIANLLEKENALIEKLKAERAQASVSQSVQRSETLRHAEAHLLLGLDEILRSNEVILRRFLKVNKEEKKDD